MRPVQFFTAEYLVRCRRMSSDEIAEFLESFRLMHAPRRGSKLISLKVPEDLLDAFKRRCRLEETPYQTQIKHLMKEWLGG